MYISIFGVCEKRNLNETTNEIETFNYKRTTKISCEYNICNRD